MLVHGRLMAGISDPCPELDLAASPLVPDRTRHERFGWLNDAFATDVARLAIHGSLQLEIIFASVPGTAREAAHPRLEITLDANARLVLLEAPGQRGAEGFINDAAAGPRPALARGAAPALQHWRIRQGPGPTQTHWTAMGSTARAAQPRARARGPSRVIRSMERLSLRGRLTYSAPAIADNSLLVDNRSRHVGHPFSRNWRGGALACRNQWDQQHAGGSRADQSLKGISTDPRAEIDCAGAGDPH